MSLYAESLLKSTFEYNMILKAVSPSQHRRYRAIAPPVVGHGPVIPQFALIENLARDASDGVNMRLPTPVGWYPYTQPEGAKYFYNPSLRIVTPSDICNPENWDVIMKAFERVIELIKLKDRELPITSEIYLEIQTISPQRECRYYLIDHSIRIPFWLDDISTEELGLEAVESPDHMRSMLIPEYWLHVEHFPMHNLYPLEAEEELIAILAHGLVDDKTAPTSTTPYGAKEAKHFLQALDVMKSTMTTTQQDGYRLCTVARLWLMIARTRHVNAYGLKAPRLDRLQGLGPTEGGEEISRILETLSGTVLLGTPRTTFKRLRNLWHGRIVYQRHWQAFFEDIRREWIHSGALTLGIWIADVGLLYLTPAKTVSRDLATASCGFAVTGVLLSSALYRIHNEDQLSGAYAITEYLIRVESYDYGLQPLSVMLSLPYAFALWSILTFSAALVVILLEHAERVSLSSLVGALACGGLPILFLFNAAAFFAGQSGPIGFGVDGIRWVGRCVGNAVRQLIARRNNHDQRL
ncbi:hypothetical protein FRC03_008937 [Tulasnella sp. 419]|nr:hypothetical protein FRC02_005759 [Tulasnella sp. 418]KAG8958662.1 hypothetical protein FRC03_008937 [Tulasnella sp. 419]